MWRHQLLLIGIYWSVKIFSGVAFCLPTNWCTSCSFNQTIHFSCNHTLLMVSAIWFSKKIIKDVRCILGYVNGYMHCSSCCWSLCVDMLPRWSRDVGRQIHIFDSLCNFLFYPNSLDKNVHYLQYCLIYDFKQVQKRPNLSVYIEVYFDLLKSWISNVMLFHAQFAIWNHSAHRQNILTDAELLRIYQMMVVSVLFPTSCNSIQHY